ncbi:MAG: hypothetical protein J1F16_01150 [Muribaculaceae bacterium]|nr:hypothetical protein [Muribaculaceae bacterium]
MSKKNSRLSDIIYECFPSGEIFLNEVIEIFKKHNSDISSETHIGKNKNLKSNDVLKILSNDLESIGYKVEKGKSQQHKITFTVPGTDQKFDVDAYNDTTKTIIEVEAGRGWANNQFLKDLFEACAISDIEYLVIAVKKIYQISNQPEKKDYVNVRNYIDTLYKSRVRNMIPLKGILMIGY